MKNKHITIRPLDLIKVKVFQKFLKELEEEIDIRCGMQETNFTIERNDYYWWNREQ